MLCKLCGLTHTGICERLKNNPGETKPTNPKDMVASNKPPYHLWPPTATVYGAYALLDGAMKYGRSNWRAVGAKASVYHDAALRHIAAWWEGENVDSDSGLPHLAHALACLAILVDSEAAGQLNDDRAFPGGYRALVSGLAGEADRLRKKHQDVRPKHYTAGSEPPCFPNEKDFESLKTRPGAIRTAFDFQSTTAYSIPLVQDPALVVHTKAGDRRHIVIGGSDFYFMRDTEGRWRQTTKHFNSDGPLCCKETIDLYDLDKE